MPFILGANETKVTGYDVANSVRFDGSSSYMSFAPSSHMNMDRWTWSCWVKRSKLGAVQTLFNCDNAASDLTELQFLATDQLHFENLVSNSIKGKRVTTRVFRDVSSWMHIMVVWDSGNATAGDRIKIYINGVQETSFDTSDDPDQNTDSSFGENNQPIRIGVLDESSAYFSGYMCEVVVLDGTAAAVTDFGEFNEDSPRIWQPIDVSGLTFGSQGFYLDFEDSGDLGDDESGNGNDFTETNLAATDQTTDTCTNNFATLNSLVNFNSGVFTEGNCAITFGDDTISTIGVTRGRWYWEAQRTNTSNEAHFGIGLSRGFSSATSIVSSGDRVYVRGGATFVSATSNLSILTFGSNNGTPASVGNGDVIGFYLDLESDTKNITIKKNDGATPVIDIDLTYSGSDAEEPIFAFCRMNSGCSSSWNFGNPIAALTSANSDPNGYGSFEFSTTLSSVDYYALCSKNLAEFG